MIIRNKRGLVRLHIVAPIVAVLMVGMVGTLTWGSGYAASRAELVSAIFPSKGFDCFTRAQYYKSGSDGKGYDSIDKACVRTIQDTINTWYAARGLSTRLAVDGDFGVKTYNSVKEYQQYYKGYVVYVDGIVGTKTYCSMYAMLRQMDGCPFATGKVAVIPAGAVTRPPVSATTTASTGGTAPAPRASTTGSAIVAEARKYIGVPYVSGGSTPAGFDCSGFTQYVYAKFGISLPRTSAAQRYAGRVVSSPQPGDLIWGPGHVGIYTGNGNHIAARSPGVALKESPIYLTNPIFIRVL